MSWQPGRRRCARPEAAGTEHRGILQGQQTQHYVPPQPSECCFLSPLPSYPSPQAPAWSRPQSPALVGLKAQPTPRLRCLMQCGALVYQAAAKHRSCEPCEEAPPPRIDLGERSISLDEPRRWCGCASAFMRPAHRESKSQRDVHLSQLVGCVEQSRGSVERNTPQGLCAQSGAKQRTATRRPRWMLPPSSALVWSSAQAQLGECRSCQQTAVPRWHQLLPGLLGIPSERCARCALRLPPPIPPHAAPPLALWQHKIRHR